MSAKSFFCRLLAGAAALALSLSAQASVYTLQGAVETAESYFDWVDASGFVGTALTGQFTVDTTGLDASSDDYVYVSLTSYQLLINGYEYTDDDLKDVYAVYYKGELWGLSGDFGGYPGLYLSFGYNAALDGAFFEYSEEVLTASGYYTISEVTEEVPEPASLALSLAALGGLGLVMRRRKPA